MSARSLLHQIETITYIMNEKEVLTDLNQSLKELYSSVQNKVPNKDGLVLRPRDQRQVINKRRRVWKAKALLKYSSLPGTRRRKRAPSSIRNRFGIKADKMRQALQVNCELSRSKAAFFVGRFIARFI